MTNPFGMFQGSPSMSAPRACSCGWTLPTVALPVRARRGALGAIVRPTLDEIEKSRIADAYVALPCPHCGERHVLHTAESAVAAGLVPSDAFEGDAPEPESPTIVVEQDDGEILLPRIGRDREETLESLRMWLATTELWDRHEGDRAILLASLSAAARALAVQRADRSAIQAEIDEARRLQDEDNG